jgi:predicted transcriptional regulator
MSSLPEQSDYYSRSALASKLDITLKELTQAMLEAGWLRYEEQSSKGKEWALTSKGEFEGGIYKTSKKFGQYIAWPQSVLTHTVILELKNSLINATTIAKAFNVSAKTLNKLLADLGWACPSKKGWRITEGGVEEGGIQQKSEATSIPFVLWQRRILENTILSRHITLYKGACEPSVAVGSTSMGTDKNDSQTYHRLLNGLSVFDPRDIYIANYLYLYGIRYAYQRSVSVKAGNVTTTVIGDFYLPDSGIYLFIQRAQISPTKLSEQIERLSRIQQSLLPHIVLSESDVSTLERLLPKLLLDLGVTLY